MSDKIVNTDEYRAFIQDVKQRIQSSQIKAAVSVNRELLLLYWELAERIVAKQQEAAWGDGFLLRMSRDLQEAFPGMKGFSKRNLELMRQWYSFWVRESSNAQQLVAQIWRYVGVWLGVCRGMRSPRQVIVKKGRIVKYAS